MTTNYGTYTSDYLSSTQSVLRAGKWLRNTPPEAGLAKLEFAITQLEQAAQQQETGGMGYRAFMFSELETAPAADKPLRERLTEDALASVLTDLQIADVLMAAGQAVGETDEKAEPRFLDESLLRLEGTARSLERSLLSPLAGGPEPGRFGFTAEAVIPTVTPSPDLPSAIATFRNCSNETLTTLVNEAQGAVTSTITALSELDQAQVLVALSKLGEVEVKELFKIGRLFRLGVEKLKGAINALIRLFGSKTLAHIKAQVEKIWQDVKAGKQVAQVLEWAFDIETTRTRIADILCSAGLKREPLDEASSAVVQLDTAFKENMTMFRRLAAAVGLAGTLLAFINPGLAALAAASAYVLIIAAVILIGMDYADSGRLLQRVRGVGEIANSLLVA